MNLKKCFLVKNLIFAILIVDNSTKVASNIYNMFCVQIFTCLHFILNVKKYQKNYKNKKMCCCVSSRRKPTKTLVKNSIRAFLCFTFNIYYYHHCRLYNFTRMRPKSSDLRHFLSKKAANLPSKTHIIKQLVQVNLWPTLFEKLKEGSLK